MSRPLEDVQDEILDRLHAGESIDREALLAEHPEHAEALGAFLEVLAIVEGSAGDGPELATLGEFRILGELGRGGMGRVYEAEQTSLKRRVALKVLPPTLRLDGRLVSRFRREAEAAGRLRHPGIVPVFSVGEAAGTPFFAMELVEGVSLQQVLEKRRANDDAGLPADPEGWRQWAVETAAKVADALAYAHEQGILHRDVKPANILLDESGNPRLTDFGLALDLRAPELTQTGEVFGSPQYMSPEQAVRRETPIDERTDVYSLAVTLYELLTLRLPYDGTTSAEVLTALVAGKVVPPRKVDPSMPRGLEQVLLGALSRDPDERYRGAADFAADLRASVAGQAPTHAPPVKMGRRPWVPIAVGAAVVIVLIGLAWRLGGGETPPLSPPGDDTATAGGTDAEPTVFDERARIDPAAIAALERDLTVLGPNATAEEFRAAIARLRGVESPVAKEALRGILEAYVAGPGADDAEARAALGYRFFAHEVPEAIAFRGYPHVRAVERAAEKRWFGRDEQAELQLALRAWQETLRHEKLLLSDRSFRLEDGVRSRLGMDPRYADLHVRTRWAGEHLLVHVGSDPTSVYDSVAQDGGFEDLLARAKAEGQAVDARLRGLGADLVDVHDAFTVRFQHELGLRPLTDPWGGRPDLAANVRSFEDGIPLVVLVFDGADTFRSALGLPLPPGVDSMFLAKTGHLYLSPAGSEEDAASARSMRLHDAVHQLEFWYGRQRRRWRQLPVGQTWVSEGLADYLSVVEREGENRSGILGPNRVRLQSMQAMQKQLAARERDYPLFPLATLVSFRTFNEARQWGAAEFGLPPHVCLGLYYDQSWALTYFLNEAEEGRYQEGFTRYLVSVLNGETAFAAGTAPFFKALGLQTEAEQRVLDEAFHTWVRDHLMTLELPK